MVNDQDNTNNEIRTMANGQDKTKMINEGKFKKHKETEKTFHISFVENVKIANSVSVTM